MSSPSSPILITGGAGYIGSHIVYNLLDHGHSVIVVDNLCTGHGDSLPDNVTLVQQDVLDTAALTTVMRKHGIKTVIHMAAFLLVEESVAKPLDYYRNNVDGTRSVVQACLDAGVEKLIFSSTGAVYASSEHPLREGDPTEPGSPYGRSKLMAETVIRDAVASSDLKAVALRYFNVASADPAGRTGQKSNILTHLITRACFAATGKLPQFGIYGTDYPTPDGTCVRDYIHVSDLAEAHRVVMAQNFTENFKIFNCGYGTGFSVAEVIARFKAVTGVDFPVQHHPRRPGDLAQTVADNRAILQETAWRPRYNDLDTIIRHAWAWHCQYNDFSL